MGDENDGLGDENDGLSDENDGLAISDCDEVCREISDIFKHCLGSDFSETESVVREDSSEGAVQNLQSQQDVDSLKNVEFGDSFKPISGCLEDGFKQFTSSPPEIRLITSVDYVDGCSKASTKESEIYSSGIYSMASDFSNGSTASNETEVKVEEAIDEDAALDAHLKLTEQSEKLNSETHCIPVFANAALSTVQESEVLIDEASEMIETHEDLVLSEPAACSTFIEENGKGDEFECDEKSNSCEYTDGDGSPLEDSGYKPACEYVPENVDGASRVSTLPRASSCDKGILSLEESIFRDALEKFMLGDRRVQSLGRPGSSRHSGSSFTSSTLPCRATRQKRCSTKGKTVIQDGNKSTTVSINCSNRENSSIVVPPPVASDEQDSHSMAKSHSHSMAKAQNSAAVLEVPKHNLTEVIHSFQCIELDQNNISNEHTEPALASISTDSLQDSVGQSKTSKETLASEQDGEKNIALLVSGTSEDVVKENPVTGSSVNSLCKKAISDEIRSPLCVTESSLGSSPTDDVRLPDEEISSLSNCERKERATLVKSVPSSDGRASAITESVLQSPEHAIHIAGEINCLPPLNCLRAQSDNKQSKSKFSLRNLLKTKRDDAGYSKSSSKSLPQAISSSTKLSKSSKNLKRLPSHQSSSEFTFVSGEDYEKMYQKNAQNSHHVSSATELPEGNNRRSSSSKDSNPKGFSKREMDDLFGISDTSDCGEGPSSITDNIRNVLLEHSLDGSALEDDSPRLQRAFDDAPPVSVSSYPDESKRRRRMGGKFLRRLSRSLLDMRHLGRKKESDSRSVGSAERGGSGRGKNESKAGKKSKRLSWIW